MTTRSIRNPEDLERAVQIMRCRKMPYTVTLTNGIHRSTQQNRLQRQWLNEIAEQLGDTTPEAVRGECKLRHGVPILRAENEAFCEKYDRLIKPRPYEEKVELMMEPLDFPVTRIMTVDQHRRYLDAISQYYTAQGIILTDPDAMERAA